MNWIKTVVKSTSRNTHPYVVISQPVKVTAILPADYRIAMLEESLRVQQNYKELLLAAHAEHIEQLEREIDRLNACVAEMNQDVSNQELDQ